MNYLILDDEPIAHQIIQDMCEDLPYMDLQGNCFDAAEAYVALAKNKVDVVFLDLHLPGLGGFDFLRSLAHPPHVIVISAYSDHAVEGFELEVVDYLVKPFSKERLLKAIIKVKAQMAESLSTMIPDNPESLFLRDGKRHYQIVLADILFIEACGNYCVVHLTKGRIMTQEKISELESKLPEGFIRVHKSYIVAGRKIQHIESNEVRVGDNTIPVGRVYKPNLNKLLNA